MNEDKDPLWHTIVSCFVLFLVSPIVLIGVVSLISLWFGIATSCAGHLVEHFTGVLPQWTGWPWLW